MNCPLAIFTPVIGARSETFIRRHIQDLLPGGTAVVALSTAENYEAERTGSDGPCLLLNEIKGTWEGRARRLLRKCGLPVAQPDPITKAVEKFLTAHKVKAILGEYLDQSLVWLPVAKKMGIRFYGHAHGYDISICLRQAKWQKAYLQYNEADGIIAVSQSGKNRLINLGISESKIHVISCNVDVPPKSQVRPARDEVRCLAVGRMVAKKAPILTLDAFRRAAEALPNLRLDYVGTGELLPAAQQFVQVFGLGGKVTLHKGQSSDVVHRLMREADLFLQHSMTDPETGDEEGMPVAILEAMAWSLPVVSTRHAGIPEAVTDGFSGYLVNEGDSITMAERIVALARDRNLRQQMGVAGWQRAKADFTWEQERTELLKVMQLEEG
jgi:colanic acid/amylovoran biosynthesis glycosyltransferase